MQSMLQQVDIELYESELQEMKLEVSQPRQCLITTNEIIHYVLTRRNGVLGWHEEKMGDTELFERVKTLLILTKNKFINRDQPRLYTIMPFTGEILEYLIKNTEWVKV